MRPALFSRQLVPVCNTHTVGFAQLVVLPIVVRVGSPGVITFPIILFIFAFRELILEVDVRRGSHSRLWVSCDGVSDFPSAFLPRFPFSPGERERGGGTLSPPFPSLLPLLSPLV